MPLFKLGETDLEPVSRQSMVDLGIRERGDLQRVLRDHVGVIAPGTLVIAEEFSEWQDSRRRIDLLGIHEDGSLVVIELKRTDDGGHMDLQAIRYAAMVSPLTFERAVEVFSAYLKGRGLVDDAEQLMLRHLGWSSPEEEDFGGQVRIVLAGADFSPELTTSVLWLNTQGLDISCVRLMPYSHDGAVLLDVQQVIPLPEATDYLVRLREKNDETRSARRRSTRAKKFYTVTVGEEVYPRLPNNRAIFTVVRRLVETGIAPEDIQSALPEGQRQRFFELAGDVVREADFVEAAQRVDQDFKPGAWFTQEWELLHHGGKTYAFSAKWGRWTEMCMERLVEAYPEAGISFSCAG